MKRYLGIISIVLTLVSCEKWDDYYYEINKKPEIKFYKENKTYNDTITKDSIKVNTTFILDYKILDEQELTLDIQAEEKFKQGITFDKNKIYIKGLYHGNLNFSAIAKDVYGKTYQKDFSFRVFSNLKPIAVLKLNQISIVMKNEVEINAIDSYDGDKIQGGYITMYEYTIDNNVITIEEPVLKFIFNSSGNKEVSLRVKDNEDSWSDVVKSVITLN